MLIAGSSAGITVQEVFSNGFFSSEHKGTYEYLSKIGSRTKWKKRTETTENGYQKISFQQINTDRTAERRWKSKQWVVQLDNGINYIEDIQLNLTCKRKPYKEKETTQRHKDLQYCDIDYSQNETTQTTYTNKIRGKNTRPIGPWELDDWFPSCMKSDEFRKTQFYGTEIDARTNIVSDFEAYITRTIKQTGYIDEWLKYPVNVPSSMLRTYMTHITTDDDHVYIHQDIREVGKNCMSMDRQEDYTTDYTLTLKKGRCVREKETITKISQENISQWYQDYRKSRDSGETITVVSSSNSRRPPRSTPVKIRTE